MFTVIRVECEHGVGPYQDNCRACDRGDGRVPFVNCGNEPQPPPARDPGILRHIHKHESCGFFDWEHLRGWWSGVRAVEGSSRYVLGVYEVPAPALTGVGANQVLFLRTAARLVCRMEVELDVFRALGFLPAAPFPWTGNTYARWDRLLDSDYAQPVG
jgi:hypothetical protein